MDAMVKLLRSRQDQIMLSFSFWGDPEPNDKKQIYELRTYTLKVHIISSEVTSS